MGGDITFVLTPGGACGGARICGVDEFGGGSKSDEAGEFVDVEHTGDRVGVASVATFGGYHRPGACGLLERSRVVRAESDGEDASDPARNCSASLVCRAGDPRDERRH
ncbi:hypothetical protein OV079_16510 [Nannocystis pusilla]|uniref:Uncharacterized protein n=1 Tax=Nannocystis pusilla TaxID=889268 RepID=A0A9X3EX13_9BACT|nr:hypothetical protein [Nannocystis pusilla]MCY1007128.1 hypothetical protein [Nannocystis pusilla]